jgi:hypothetical protein
VLVSEVLIGQTQYAFEGLRGYAAVGLFVTAVALILARGWRTSLLVLLLQYVLLAMLLSQYVRREIALASFLTHALICIMLYLAARQVDWRPVLSLSSPGLAGAGKRTRKYEPTPWQVYSSSVPFRLLLALLGIPVTFTLMRTYPLPLPELTPVCYWLGFAGLLILALTQDSLKAGQGLLTLLGGFQLIFFGLESSLVIAWLWGVFTLLLGLALSYLTVAGRVGLAGEEG